MATMLLILKDVIGPFAEIVRDWQLKIEKDKKADLINLLFKSLRNFKIHFQF